MGLFGADLSTIAKLLSDTNWRAAFVANLTTINNGLPAAKVIRATNQSFANATIDQMSWSGTEYDLPGGSWAAGNPTRLVLPYAGRYLVAAALRYAANNVGNRQLGLWKNHATELWTQQLPNTGGVIATSLNFCDVFTFAAGDYLEVYGLQDSGGALNAVTPFCDLSYCKIG